MVGNLGALAPIVSCSCVVPGLPRPQLIYPSVFGTASGFDEIAASDRYSCPGRSTGDTLRAVRILFLSFAGGPTRTALIAIAEFVSKSLCTGSRKCSSRAAVQSR
jgi:hypothetical protein